MKKIKDFLLRLQKNNTGESIVIDEAQFKRDASAVMNENIRRYNRMLEDIENIRREIKAQLPEFERASREFIMFVSIPKEADEAVEENASSGPKNPYANDFMLRRNEFEDKVLKLRKVFDKIAELRKNEISKYFEAKRLINNNSIVIGEKTDEIEISEPGETIDEINASNAKNKYAGKDK